MTYQEYESWPANWGDQPAIYPILGAYYDSRGEMRMTPEEFRIWANELAKYRPTFYSIYRAGVTNEDLWPMLKELRPWRPVTEADWAQASYKTWSVDPNLAFPRKAQQVLGPQPDPIPVSEIMTRNVVAFLSIGLLIVITLLRPSNSTAQWDDYVIVQPPQPTEADEISIVVGGVWSDSCIPRYYYHSIQGNTIVIYAVAGAPPGVVCAMVITAWEFATPVGHLSAGSYTVELRIFSLWGWECPPI